MIFMIVRAHRKKLKEKKSLRKNLTSVIVFLLILLTSSVLLVWSNGPVQFFASYSTNLPVIDGSLTDPEWNDANSYAISLMRNDGVETVSATVYFKHDCTNIYIGLKVFASQHDEDKFVFFFDEGDDGSYGSGTRDGILMHNQEDAKAYTTVPPGGGSKISDGYFYGTHMWVTYTQEIDFDAECVFVVDHWELEFRIPFVGNDGGAIDVSDLVCTVSDTIGIKIQYYNGGDWLTGNYFYPPGDLYEIETYTTLSFVPPTGVIPEVPLGTIMISAAMIVALVAYVTMPKWRRKREYVNL